MSRQVTFAGNPANLDGEEVKVGDIAKDFTALDQDLNEVKLSDFKGKKVIISVYPSVDTGVCSLQQKTFNKKADSLGKDVQIIGISVDLPFALGRFCAAEGIDKLVSVSDHKDLDFANKYGFLLSDFRLLERGIVVIDKEGIIKHVEYCSEVTNEPNYDEALEILANIM